MSIEAPDNNLAPQARTAVPEHAVPDVAAGPTPWRDPTAVLTAVEQFVASPEPAVVLASLAALCAAAIADECWGTLVQAGMTQSIGTAPDAGVRDEPASSTRTPSAGEDQLTLSFGQSAWEHYPEFSGTVTWRWYDRDRPTRSDKVIVQLLLDRAIELVRTQRLELAVAAERNKAANLEVALASNREIGQAIGILMAAYKLTSQQGFDLLRMASQHAHRKLREVAREVCETGMLELPAPRSRP
jgi:hypothetical protein